MRTAALVFVAPLLVGSVSPPDDAGSRRQPLLATRSLDGGGNNRRHPQWGQANTLYLRLAPANYADADGTMVGGPSVRYVSNRVFNDTSQNLFSENGVTQWGFVWGQFLDHTFGLRQEVGGEDAPISFDGGDPIEGFTNDLGSIDFSRTPAAPLADQRGRRASDTLTSVREQLNTISSYIDASSVYGDTAARLEWLRDGPVDGDLTNNAATLLLPNQMLPRRDARADAASAPEMSLFGPLVATPEAATVAGDARANENLSLAATHTLFAREHNRIVSLLPADLPENEKFEIARRVVGAEQQYITYTEFLPSLGVTLAPYRGYDPRVNAGLTNEFAVVGYRAHSMIHGEIESIGEASAYTTEQLAAIEAHGVEIVQEDDEIEFVIPLNVAFGNPGLLELIGLDAVLAGIGAESQYKNDEQMDNQLRSVLFQIPVPGNPACLDGPALPACYRSVADLGAIDIQRGRDHGMPTYNELRQAFGLAPATAFVEITGEATEEFPDDPEIDAADPLNDPDILDFVSLADAAGNAVPLGSPAADTDAVTGVRRTSLAARLKAIYGDPRQLDAFVGMVAEPHRPGSEMGELQHAIWKQQFEALRDGDRFFYLNDPVLAEIQARFGITYEHTLGEIVNLNTAAAVPTNVFTSGE